MVWYHYREMSLLLAFMANSVEVWSSFVLLHVNKRPAAPASPFRCQKSDLRCFDKRQSKAFNGCLKELILLLWVLNNMPHAVLRLACKHFLLPHILDLRNKQFLWI
jgi:hypothetical protein